MKRIVILLGSCLVSSLACGTAVGSNVDERSLEEEFVGGWDAEGSKGSAILLIREGLVGTLNITSLAGAERQYHVLFDVEGELEEESVSLALNCAEARERNAVVEPSEDDDPAPGSAADTGDGDGDEDETSDEWTSVDCSGWDLELACSLAGECNTGDCNMVCDITFFGDAYAHSQIELGSVEDAFDYWQRV